MSSTDSLVYDIYSKSEVHYRAKIEELAQRAHPVIKRVHDDDRNDYKSILVPFTDGRKTIQISTDIEESVATEAKSVMKSLEKQIVLASCSCSSRIYYKHYLESYSHTPPLQLHNQY